MSRIMRRKHIQKTMGDLSLPSEVQTIALVNKVLGNYLLEVKQPDESIYLASIPTKFRKNVWVVRGGYVLVEPIAEGDKVKGEIVKVLQSDDIKYYKEEKVWPEAFQCEKVEKKVQVVNNNSNSDDDDDDELFVNTNRVRKISIVDDDSSSSESSDSSEESESDFEDAEESQEKPNVHNDAEESQEKPNVQNDAK